MRSDESWFNELFGRHATDIYRYFIRRAPADEADDLTADTFTTAWRRRADIPAEAELPWLYRTAGFILANHRRKGRPIPIAETPDGTDVSGSVPSADSVIEAEAIRSVLADLSPRDREVLMLAAWEGLVGQELASALGLSRAAADAALYRARSHLMAAWNRQTP